MVNYSKFKLFEPPGDEVTEGEAVEAPLYRQFKRVSDDPELMTIGYLLQVMENLDSEFMREGHTAEGKKMAMKDRIAKWFFHRYSLGIPVDK